MISRLKDRRQKEREGKQNDDELRGTKKTKTENVQEGQGWG